MNADAIAADIVKTAMRRPPMPSRERARLCQYDKAFCVICPDSDRLPCVTEGVYRDCGDCATSGCPCMTRPATKRHDAYQVWRDRLNAINARMAERYARKRPSEYRLGRKCSSCGAPIMDRGKSGMCLSCTRRRPRT